MNMLDIIREWLNKSNCDGFFRYDADGEICCSCLVDSLDNEFLCDCKRTVTEVIETCKAGIISKWEP